MKNKPLFQKRLAQAQNAGKLSTADLAFWFDRPYHTVRGWLIPRADRGRKGGYKPWGPYQREIYRRLEELEKIVDAKIWISVQQQSPKVRQKVLKALRREWDRTDRTLSKTHTAA